jgi:aryl-alcohol dehydrogenase-like predicted oxidoreductase
VALAWVADRGKALQIPVVPIPGTKRVKWLEQNAAALDVEITDEDRAELDPLSDLVVGGRY